MCWRHITWEISILLSHECLCMYVLIRCSFHNFFLQEMKMINLIYLFHEYRKKLISPFQVGPELRKWSTIAFLVLLDGLMDLLNVCILLSAQYRLCTERQVMY